MTTGVTVARAAQIFDPSGADRTLIVTMVAIARAESGWNATAIGHDSDGTSDYGLWQINSSHTDLFRQYDWKVPADNAKMAKSVYDSQGYSAWSTYTSGAYKRFIPMAEQAVNQASGQTPGGVHLPSIPNPLDALSGLTSLIGKIFDPNLWKRIGIGLLGAIVTIMGVIILIKNDTGAVGDTVSKAAEIGAVA